MAVPVIGLKLSEVTAEIPGTQTKLSQCVTDHAPTLLDNVYYTAPLNSLKDFRGYGDDTQAPTAPTGLYTYGISATQIDLGWVASTDNVGVTRYGVVVDGGSEVNVGNVLHYLFTGFTEYSQHSFRVYAYDAANNKSASSNLYTIYTLDVTGPTTPVLSYVSRTTTSISVSWGTCTDSGIGMKEYRMYRNGTFVTTVATGTTSYTYTGLTHSTSYNLTMYARDLANNDSTVSNTVTRSTATPITVTAFDTSAGGEGLSGDACFVFTDTTRYKTGGGTSFFVDDVVYTDSGGTTTFNGLNFWYATDYSKAIKIDGNGVITSVANC